MIIFIEGFTNDNDKYKYQSIVNKLEQIIKNNRKKNNKFPKVTLIDRSFNTINKTRNHKVEQGGEESNIFAYVNKSPIDISNSGESITDIIAEYIKQNGNIVPDLVIYVFNPLNPNINDIIFDNLNCPFSNYKISLLNKEDVIVQYILDFISVTR